MLGLQLFLRRFQGAQRRNRTADTGIFNRLQHSENAERSATKRHGRELYVGDLGFVGLPSITSGGWS